MSVYDSLEQSPSDGMALIPQIYRQDCIQILIDELSIGKHIKDICKDVPGMPSPKTLKRIIAKHPAFAQKVTDALKTALVFEADRILEIADGRERSTSRDRLRIQTRMKLLERLDPKNYAPVSRMKIETVPQDDGEDFVQDVAEENEKQDKANKNNGMGFLPVKV